jgi:class 3 adenylate cyclase/tetratricopeptide (TPR) repeat protein
VFQETVAAQAPPRSGPGPARFEGERRVVTALLAHVGKPTPLAGQIDLELWLETVNEVLGILAAEVYRYGGEVSQLRQDGLVATFGPATAHEDDPERAVLAALAMQEAMQHYGADLVRREGADAELRLRVGVNTGQAVVTRVGNGGQGQMGTALGEAVSLAGRIGEAAEPGTVLVGENTYRLVRPLFEWQMVGEVAIAGEHDAVTVCRPLARKALPDKGRGIEGLSSPLVGRDAEMRALQEALEGLKAGVGGIVTVVGDAGIGKSRLVAEIREICKSANGKSQIANPQIGEPTTQVQWIEGRCLSYATTVAYQLWLDVLRGLLGVAADAAPPAAADVLRERVRALCPDCAGEVYPFLGQMMSLPLAGDAAARLQGIEAEGLKVLTFRAVRTLLERATGRGPLAIVCEDLHWADPTSLALLEHLLSLTDRVPLLMICVFRPETEHPCWRIKQVATQSYHHRHTDLWLEPLSPAESASLVGNLLQIEDLPQGLRARILGHAEGNPFYVEEILRALIDGGTIVYDEAAGHWGATRDIADIPVPDTLRGVLTARIDRLPGAARHVLQLASVVGRNFERCVLEGISQRGRDLDEDLVALQRAQIIRQRARLPEAAYIFKHQLTQEAAYDSLLRRKRRDLHRRVAQALERLYPERVEEQLGLLAHHWERAGEAERAIPYLRRAGERAAAQFANAEAVAYFGRVLDLVPEESVERYVLLLAREQVYELQGDREAQGRDLASLAGLAETLGDKAKRAEVAIRRARYLHRIGENTKTVSAAQAAVRLAQAAQNVCSEAMAYREWGRALGSRGNREESRLHLERALALARDAGLRQVEAEVLHTLGGVLGAWTERGMACYEQGLRICRQIGDRRREAEALRDVGFSLGHRGNWTEGEEYLQQSLNVCRETGNRRDEAWALLFLGGMLNYRGHYARARNSIEQGLSICREVRDRVGEREGLWYLGYSCIALGDYAAARDYLEQSLRIFREMKRRGTDGWVLVALGLVFHLRGDYASAGTCYEQALRIGRETDRWFVEARALMYTGLLSHHLGDDSAAREYSQQALRVIANLDTLLAVELISVFDVLGHALAGLGHLAEAADAYHQGLTLRRERGQHHLVVEPLAGLARVTLAQGDPAGALVHVGEILDYLSDHPALEGTLEPLRIYLTCYRVLLANGDPRAEEILDAAHHLLQERAATIEDEDLWRSYLENVPAHREIVALWEEAPHP